MSRQLLETLPIEVQAEILQTLKAYDKQTVTYENGRYTYGVCIKSHYAPDHKFIGTFYAKEIYPTVEERIVNYVESFHDFPIFYEQKRDYMLISKMDKIGWSAKVKLVDGIVTLIEQ